MSTPITTFGTEKYAETFEPCIDHYGPKAPKGEWENNVLSSETVVYDSGVIAKKGIPVEHRVDRAELALCERLAAQASAIIGDAEVGMRSEGTDPFVPYYQVANVGSGGAPAVVDAALLRRLFGDTICPVDKVFIEPLVEGGFFWKELTDGVDQDDDSNIIGRWRKLISFFKSSPDLVHPSFACIGFYEYAAPEGATTASTEKPPGFAMHGSALPRLAFAFTHAGSVVGLFGHAVWT